MTACKAEERRNLAGDLRDLWFPSLTLCGEDEAFLDTAKIFAKFMCGTFIVPRGKNHSSSSQDEFEMRCSAADERKAKSGHPDLEYRRKWHLPTRLSRRAGAKFNEQLPRDEKRLRIICGSE